MQVILANPRGFCAGVVRAIDIVEHALAQYGPPIYVFHEIVHNKFVLADLTARGVIFVEDLAQIPEGAMTIFSAHGVAREIGLTAQQRKLQIIDATCPLVTKVHKQVEKLCQADYEVIVIGHPTHPEILGTVGQCPPDQRWRLHHVENIADIDNLNITNPARLGYVSQTTLSVDETRDIICKLQQRYPAIVAPASEDICYATQNRQEAVKSLCALSDVILVVGSKTSSNSNSLKLLAEKSGVPAYLIDGPEDIQQAWLTGCDTIGVTAGASAPDVLIQSVLTQLRRWGVTAIRELPGVTETVFFHLPRRPQANKQRQATTA